MTIDYDVVIIGGSLAGRYAALAATQLRAKVALVEPKASVNFIYHHALSQIGKLAKQLGDAAQFGIHTSHADTATHSQLNGGNSTNTPLNFGNQSMRVSSGTAVSLEKYQISLEWQQAMLYAKGVVSNLEDLHSPAILAAQGVDVIVGNGQFQSGTHLAFAVNDTGHLPERENIPDLSSQRLGWPLRVEATGVSGLSGQQDVIPRVGNYLQDDSWQGGVLRLLRARTYLLANGSRPLIPEIEGLQKTGFLTLSDIWQSLSSPTPPKKWVIIGGVPQSIELAQTLARLGYSVTLIMERPNILPHVDSEIAQLLCSQLEAEGVRVLTQTSVTQVRRIEDKKWIQAGDKAIETDEIVVAIAQQPNVEGLNLAAVDVKWNQRRLLVNDKLQTTNRRIWACGDVIGGYEFANIANYEARIALQNALFFPTSKVNYRYIPWGISTHPMLAQVGLMEAAAKRLYNHHEVVVLRQHYKTLVSAQIRDETTGVFKLIVLRNGEILGASVLGAEAGELINLIALAIAQKIKVNCLATLSPVYPSFSEILDQIAREWSQHWLSNNTALHEFMESFFHFRRNWNL